MYKIENDSIPNTRRPWRKYDFDIMEVGQSILVPTGQKWKSAASCAYEYGKRAKKKFSIIKTKDGMRIGRVL